VSSAADASLAETDTPAVNSLRRHVGVATAIAFALRTILAAPGGMWRDEALFVFVLRLSSWSEMLTWIANEESHPPLFYVLARAWGALFGTGELAMGSLPVLLGVAIVPAAAWAGLTLASARVAVAAAYVFALSGVLIEHSVLVRPYSLLPLLGLVSATTLCLAVRSNAANWWISFVVAALAQLYTHNWGVIAVSAQLVVALGWLIADGRPFSWGRIRRAALSAAAIGVAYAPWLPIVISQARRAGHPPLSDTYGTGLLFTFYDAPIEFPFLVVCAVVLVAATVRWWRRGRLTEPAGAWAMPALLGIALLAYVEAVALSARSNLLMMRCLVTVVPCILLGVAVFIASRRSMPPPRLAFAVFLVPLAVLAGSLKAGFWRRSNAKTVAGIVDRRVQASDLIIVAPEFLASSFNYYLRASNPQIDYPSATRLGLVSFTSVMERVVDPVAFRRMQEAVRAAHEQRRRIWFVRGTGETELRARDLPVLIRLGDWGKVAGLRAYQLRQVLLRECGEPNFTSESISANGRYEVIVAELFCERS